MSSMRVPDLVVDSEISTVIDGKCTNHILDESGSGSRRRRVQVEQKWERKSHLGRGAYGCVWLEECVSNPRDASLRAVKQIRKVGQGTKRIIYYREIEAIMRFSNPRYNRCFVKSYGWYQCPDHVYITMEYCSLGDLSQHLTAPMPEEHACEIVYQILEGLYIMHEFGFAHRDLKPNNIMVVSKPPDEWWVKIADFGISKREEENLELLSTVKGTAGYLAPELLGFPIGRRTANDSKAADMWALGETTVIILTRRPTFEHVGALFNFCTKKLSLPSQKLKSHGISDAGCKFIGSLLKVCPEERLTAQAGLQHEWLSLRQASSSSQLSSAPSQSNISNDAAPSHSELSSVSAASRSWTDISTTTRTPTVRFDSTSSKAWTNANPTTQIPKILDGETLKAGESQTSRRDELVAPQQPESSRDSYIRRTFEKIFPRIGFRVSVPDEPLNSSDHADLSERNHLPQLEPSTEAPKESNENECRHKVPSNCQLKFIDLCCGCADNRPISDTYEVYIDGIGIAENEHRWFHYCPPCQEFWRRKEKRARSKAGNECEHGTKCKRDYQPTCCACADKRSDDEIRDVYGNLRGRWRDYCSACRKDARRRETSRSDDLE